MGLHLNAIGHHIAMEGKHTLTTFPKRCPYVNHKGIPCGQPIGHAVSHGNGLLTTPRDRWYSHVDQHGKPITEVTIIEDKIEAYADKADEQYIMRKGDSQCLWHGSVGRCVLRIGHFPQIPHKEN